MKGCADIGDDWGEAEEVQRSLTRRGVPLLGMFSGVEINSQMDLREYGFQKVNAQRQVWQQKGELSRVTSELLLEAAAEQLGIDVSDDEVEQEFRDRFEDADAVLEQAREAGAFESEREAMRLARTLDRIADEVERIAPEQADARERIWTPDKEKPKTETKLWTPGSKEPA